LLTAQIFSVIIFLVMFGLIISEKIERQWVSVGCGLLMIFVVFGLCMQSPAAIFRTLNFSAMAERSFWYAQGQSESASSGINWSTIIFIFGMMLMVEGMGRAGFFRWLCLQMAKLVNYRTIPLFIAFMGMSFVLAMFIDSITVILFLVAVTLELAGLLKFDPIPVVMAEIFCANLGGSATMCGDPPNIIIGTSLGFTFFDFIGNTGLIALVALVFVVAYYWLCCRKILRQSSGAPEHCPSPSSAIQSRRDFLTSGIIFALAVILLVSHAQTGLTVATIGVAVSVLTVLANGRSSLELLKKVDYKTLLFFMGLFVVVGGLEETGILSIIAGVIIKISGSNVAVMIAIVLWVSAIASAFVDNIPFAATMIPVISRLAAAQGVSLPMLAWALALGTDIGGSATPIGASANVVGLSIAARSGHIVGWGRYCKSAVPATILVMVISMVCIFLKYNLL
jgi:Na+/H+ antiporter NhaD/arsenite permease-like protein